MASFNRRDFLKATGTFIVTATLVPSCGDDDNNGTPDAPPGAPDAQTAQFRFPQGVASGDPRPTSVVLWTRVERIGGGTAPIDLTLQVATDAAFSAIVATQNVQAMAANDYTVRFIVQSLTAATTYYYRFTAGGMTASGRTRTAPTKDADVTVHFAWVNCQDYEAGVYSAYKQLLADDDARPADQKIQFVVHLGDFIYETRGNEFQRAIDESFQAITVKNPDNSDRVIPPFPSSATADHAVTVDDYRHLYKTYLSDPDMQAARARWPFIHTWDDHEFTNDSWQSMANYTDENSVDEPSQRRKVAANQAWFEYVPSQLTGAEGVTGVTQRAKDFTPATVSDEPFTAPNDDNFVAETNNAAAIASMTIYRSLRFGKHVELIITDERSYRSDHAIAEEDARELPFLDNRNVLPFTPVNVLDQGRTANGGNPPDVVDGVPNRRKTSPPGTMLGAQQKEWFKATLKGSDATWKVWGNEVMVMRLKVLAAGSPLLLTDRVANGDAWDGYNSERKELMSFVRSENIKNLVVITGDIHAHFAGIVMDDYDAATPAPVGVELVGAGISSNSLLSFYEARVRTGVTMAVRHLVVVDATAQGGSMFTENLNLLMLKGSHAAEKYAQTKDLAMANAAAVVANPHLKYADTNAQGYAVMSVTATQCSAELVTVNRPIAASANSVLRRARFTVPKDNPAGMTGPDVTGTKPFPLT